MGSTGATGQTGAQGPTTTPSACTATAVVEMPLNKRRWRGVRATSVVVVGQGGGRQTNHVPIKGGAIVRVDLRGLPCGLYYVQAFNRNRGRRSTTRAWFVSATGVTRLILVGPNPPLSEVPL